MRASAGFAYMAKGSFAGSSFPRVLGVTGGLFRLLAPEDVGIGTPEDSEKVINDVGNPRRTNFVNVIDRCGESGDWERYPVVLPSNKVLIVRMKMVARNAQFDAIAVVSIIDEVIDIDVEGHEASSDLRFV